MNEETEEYVSDEDNSMRDDLNAALEEAGGDYDESVQEVIGEDLWLKHCGAWIGDVL